MTLKLVVEVNSKHTDELATLSGLIKEGWIIARIEPASEDPANCDYKFILLRY